jgi:hypothetical protein
VSVAISRETAGVISPGHEVAWALRIADRFFKAVAKEFEAEFSLVNAGPRSELIAETIKASLKE